MSLASDVADVLRNPSVTGLVQFYMRPIFIGPMQFQQVADEIALGKIKVLCTPSKTDKFSFYDNVANEFVLRTTNTTSTKSRAVIIHEAVHAINDINKEKGVIKDFDEAMAYLASGMYLVQKGIVPNRAKSSLRAAMMVASMMLAEGQTWVSQEQIDLMLAAIRQDPWYIADFGVTKSYDGV